MSSYLKALAFAAVIGALHAQTVGTETGFQIFQTRCMACHGNPDAAQRAPDPGVIRQMLPEKIYEALTNGAMRVQGQSLTDVEKGMVALFMSGRPLGSAKEGNN